MVTHERLPPWPLKNVSMPHVLRSFMMWLRHLEDRDFFFGWICILFADKLLDMRYSSDLISLGICAKVNESTCIAVACSFCDWCALAVPLLRSWRCCWLASSGAGITDSNSACLVIFWLPRGPMAHGLWSEVAQHEWCESVFVTSWSGTTVPIDTMPPGSSSSPLTAVPCTSCGRRFEIGATLLTSCAELW